MSKLFSCIPAELTEKPKILAVISVNQTPSEAHGHSQTLLVRRAYVGDKP